MKKIYGGNEGRTERLGLYYSLEIPEDAKAVVLVIHGMMEHSGRYIHLQKKLNESKMGFFAVDLPGHGRNVPEGERPGGWMKSGFDIFIDEIGTCIREIKDAYGIPVILFGHSMGSFIAIKTMARYGDMLAACILSGTNDRQSPMLVKTGLAVADAITLLRGEQHRSPLLYNLIFGSYNKRIKPVKTKYDWLTKREDVIRRYIEDPLCGFLCTTLLYRDMAEWIMHLYDDENISMIPRELPVYIFSGDCDPVGAYGKGPRALAKRLEGHGLNSIRMDIYQGNRHECLNETNNDEVIENLTDFCAGIMGSGE